MYKNPTLFALYTISVMWCHALALNENDVLPTPAVFVPKAVVIDLVVFEDPLV